jgi:hypothetical protein
MATSNKFGAVFQSVAHKFSSIVQSVKELVSRETNNSQMIYIENMIAVGEEIILSNDLATEVKARTDYVS